MPIPHHSVARCSGIQHRMRVRMKSPIGSLLMMLPHEGFMNTLAGSGCMGDPGNVRLLLASSHLLQTG